MFFRDLITYWIISSARIDLNTGTTDWQMQYDDSVATAQGMNVNQMVTYLSDDLSILYYGASLTTGENYFYYVNTLNGQLLNSFKENASGKYVNFMLIFIETL